MGFSILGRKVIDEENAMKVVALMLGGTREKSLGFKVENAAVDVLTDNADTGRTLDLVMEARHAQAAFDFPGALLPDGMDLRIDHDKGHEGLEFQFPAIHPGLAGAIVVSRHDINDSQLDRSAYLMRREAAAILLIHGDEHLFGERADGVIDLLDLPSLATQGGMAVLDHLKRLDVLFSGLLSGVHFEIGLATAGTFLIPAS